MLPFRFQELELPNINIDVLCSKMYCVKNHWDEQSVVTGNLLNQAEEVLQVEVGLSRSIFNRDFEELAPLATHGWFKHLW